MLFKFQTRTTDARKVDILYKGEVLATFPHRSAALVWLLTHGYMAEWRYQIIKQGGIRWNADGSSNRPSWVPEMNVEVTGDLVPVTLWYRLNRVKDESTGQFVDTPDFNHYEDGHVTQKAPTPRGGTTWSGRFVYNHGYRTDELCPAIVRGSGPNSS